MVQAPLASVAPQSTPVEMPKGKNFEDILAMLEQNGEMVLASELRHHVEVIKCDDHLLELGLRDDASARVKTLQKTLSGLTGQRWMVSFTAPQGRETVAETQAKQKRAAYDAALQEPLVQQIIQAFTRTRNWLISLILHKQRVIKWTFKNDGTSPAGAIQTAGASREI